MTHLLQDIQRQPQEWERTLDYLVGDGRDSLRTAAEAIGKARHVYLTGIGSSWHAAFGAGTIFSHAGSPAYMQDAAEQLAKSRTMTPELLYILCDSYFHTGKVSDADLTAETVAAYGRNNPELMKGLIDLLQRNGQTELAQRLSSNFAQK